MFVVVGHVECFKESLHHNGNHVPKCPVCRKTTFSPESMESVWRDIRYSIARQPLRLEMGAVRVGDQLSTRYGPFVVDSMEKIITSTSDPRLTAQLQPQSRSQSLTLSSSFSSPGQVHVLGHVIGIVYGQGPGVVLVQGLVVVQGHVVGQGQALGPGLVVVQGHVVGQGQALGQVLAQGQVLRQVPGPGQMQVLGQGPMQDHGQVPVPGQMQVLGPGQGQGQALGQMQVQGQMQGQGPLLLMPNPVYTLVRSNPQYHPHLVRPFLQMTLPPPPLPPPPPPPPLSSLSLDHPSNFLYRGRLVRWPLAHGNGRTSPAQVRIIRLD